MKAPANKLAIKFPNEGVIFLFPIILINKNSNTDYINYCINFYKKNIINIICIVT